MEQVYRKNREDKQWCCKKIGIHTTIVKNGHGNTDALTMDQGIGVSWDHYFNNVIFLVCTLPPACKRQK